MARTMSEDVLSHLGLSTTDDLVGMFKDVKFVCCGGSATRMENFAKFILKKLSSSHLKIDLPTEQNLRNICRTDRYVMYKVGPVLSISHGMGMPSMSIMLNEVIKLIRYATCTDVVFIRIGTSGGLGLAPGSVVITGEAVNYEFKPIYQLPVLGHMRSWQTTLSRDVAEAIKACALPDDGYDVVINKTMATDDFYEGQGRLDGALCDYTEEDKMDYLKEAYRNGVRNIEMESTCFASITSRANIKAAVVCVTFLDRLHGDQVTATKETVQQWQERPQQLVARYILKCLEEPQGMK
ncbi:uridine phosphorylase 1-like [Ptychodera flava]|uniref:uridine phosphorylase 1-like n=1 Tax=Ptychodera flava TaxID=63121 RepID=UPI003969EE72